MNSHFLQSVTGAESRVASCKVGEDVTAANVSVSGNMLQFQ